MATWVQRTLAEGPRNGTTSHTFTFPAPAANSLLVAVGAGGVTFTTPTGWTLQASAINWTGHYLWTKVADGTETSFTTTHNGSNYPAVLAVYEFAPGSTFVTATALDHLADGVANPAITGLTGTNMLMASASGAVGSGTAAANTASWTGATKDVDAYAPYSGTDGYAMSTAYVADSTASSFSPTNSWYYSTNYREAITWAVVAASPSTAKQGSGTGSYAFTSSSTGAEAAKGSGSGTWAEAASGTGARTPKASASGTWSEAGTGTGKESPVGSGSATWSESSSGTGKNAPVGSGSGAYALGSGGTGSKSPVGSGSGTLSWGSSSAGSTPDRGSGSGALAWGSSGTGTTPAVAPHQGSGSGTLSWAGAATGAHAQRGSGTGHWAETSGAHGKAARQGSGSAALSWSSSAMGFRDLSGHGTAAYAWAASASGATPADGTLRDITVGKSAPVTRWRGEVHAHAVTRTATTTWKGSVGSNNSA